ncbi:MAG: hypothetical protein HOP11_14335 [Saprospiraceae bacterium]|nr:hypothetical protein [Saprospiraceae bacterium]
MKFERNHATGILTAIQAALIAVKLAGFVSWSWWIIASPTLLLLIAMSILGILYFIIKFY